MRVERVYTRSVVGTTRSSSIQEAARAMRRFHVGTLIVTEGGKQEAEVVGIVTDRDLVMQSLADDLNPHKVTVDKVMTPVVATVSESADVLEALGRMRAAGVRRLLVTQEGGRPVGILSIDDILDGLVAELSSVVALMKSEIRRERADYNGPRAAA